MLSLFTTLFFLSSAQQQQPPSDSSERERWSNGSHGAVAGPLAGVRAPQRVSAPPSSGLAAAPLWPDPGEPCPPGRPFFSPRTGVTAVPRRRRGRPSPFLSSSFFWLIHLFGFGPICRLGLGLGLGWPLFSFSPDLKSVLSFLFPSSLELGLGVLHPNLQAFSDLKGSRLGFNRNLCQPKPLMTVSFLLGLGFLFLDPIQNRANIFGFLSIVFTDLDPRTR